MRDSCCVYILSNKSNRVLYVGVTSNLERRLAEHRNKQFDGFTSRYNVTKLVYVERHISISDAIHREKALKSLSRSKKDALIEQFNPDWHDLTGIE